MSEHTIGTREEWQAARDDLLQAENEHAERSEELAKRRRDHHVRPRLRRGSVPGPRTWPITWLTSASFRR
jgi:hypothetical protein